jgi:hypothetical protein
MSAPLDRLLSELIGANAPARLLREVADLDSSEARLWVEAVDDSPYGFVDWAKALIAFSEWENRNRPIGVSRMREYLSCCIEGSGGSTALLPLETLLQSYLETHGVSEEGGSD